MFDVFSTLFLLILIFSSKLIKKNIPEQVVIEKLASVNFTKKKVMDLGYDFARNEK